MRREQPVEQLCGGLLLLVRLLGDCIRVYVIWRGRWL
jgi:hypothetical protein